ncbi:MAG: hypothetical protein Crog4KO_00470 [Crocinitomicaceae bacterium]
MKDIEHIIDLDKPASERWTFLAQYSDEINELLGCYLKDFQGEEEIFEGLDFFKEQAVATEYLQEIDYIASITKYTPNEVLMANLYYDALKFYFGCTAFAFESEDGVLHSRNLDWHTDNNLLSKHSRIFNFQKGGKTLFKSVGWLGFIGVLSGIKQNRFTVTLNAVISPDSPEVAKPISFFLRDVLTSENSFQEAKKALEETLIASDCLLLLSGQYEGELAVIERTPTRFATRYAENKFIIVTNDYKKLENVQLTNGPLQATSCGRFDRTAFLLSSEKPQNVESCLNLLKDKAVMMGITVQQMVFTNRTGEIELIKT